MDAVKWRIKQFFKYPAVDPEEFWRRLQSCDEFAVEVFQREKPVGKFKFQKPEEKTLDDFLKRFWGMKPDHSNHYLQSHIITTHREAWGDRWQAIGFFDENGKLELIV